MQRILTSIGLATLLFSIGSSCRAQAVVYPFVDCVDYAANDGSATAYFSYVNFDAGIAMVPLGASNYFDPPPQFRNQPATFQPGIVRRAFRVSYRADSTLTWNLLGHGATASLADPAYYCFLDRIFESGVETPL